MNVELISNAGYIFTLFLIFLGAWIITLGTWALFNKLIWDLIIKSAFSWFIVYKRLIYFLWYYRDIKKIIGNKADNIFEEENPPI